MKSAVLAFASLLFPLFSKGVAAQDACKAKLNVAFLPTLCRVGESVKVRVVIQQYEGDIPYYTFDGTLNYEEGVLPNPNAIEVLKYPQGVFRDGLISSELQADAHRFRFVIVGAKRDSTGSAYNAEAAQTTGPVADILFTSTSQTPRPYSITLTQAEVPTTNLDDFGSCPTTGTIQVTAPATRGDVDGDGKVTVSDVQWAIRLLLGSATGSPGVLASADVWPQEKADGQLTLADIVTLLRKALAP